MADKSRKPSNPQSSTPLLLLSAGEGLTLNSMSGSAMLMPVPQSEASLIPTDGEEVDSFLGQSPPKQSLEPAPFTFFKQRQTNTVDPFAQVGFSDSSLNSSLSTNASHSVSIPTPVESSFSYQSSPASVTSNVGPPPSDLSQSYRKQQNPYSSPGNLNHFSSNLSGQDVSTPQMPYGSSQMYSTPITSPIPSTLPPNIPPLQSYVPEVTYRQVDPHWFYCTEIEKKNIWIPMSFLDTLKLEEVFNKVKISSENAIVCIDGGRYDVNIIERTRKAIYWEESPKSIRRCTWFYKEDRDKRYIPYEEDRAERLEMEYKNAILTNTWHKSIQFSDGESVIMHNINVIVYFQPNSTPDEWGSVPEGQLRPKIVRRGIEYMLDQIGDGETVNIDHICFVIPGIGSVCDLRFRNIVECVDDFRSISQTLMKTHFSRPVTEKRINRVEFLPVYWHSALHGSATGVDRRLKAITLQSIPKLRHFTNDTLLDILFYTSPTYCQTIVDTVAMEMNRLYKLFLSRNPNFKGGVSIIGHSLGSLILFDLLSHQNMDSTQQLEDNFEKEPSPLPLNQEVVETIDQNNETESKEPDLEEMLTNIGLGEYVEIFQKEKIDMETLIVCSESDIKDLGLPMGPRKKLMMFLKEKIAEIEVSKKKAKDASLTTTSKESESADKSSSFNKNSMTHQGSTASVNYTLGVAGTGQPFINYPQLDFNPSIFFALGSPIGMFLTVRGIEMLGEEFLFPSCPGFFNIFHPFDPVAYRIEPLIVPNLDIKPVLMPHHKGRKRLHLELRDSLTRVGVDIKNRVLESIRSTWNSINEFARAHRYTQAQVEAEVDKVVEQIQHQNDDTESNTTESPSEEEIPMGQLNGGHRVDYVLQEKPIESFNDYLFALQSHTCYWVSEDSALLILKEIYALMNVTPQIQKLEEIQKSTKKSLSPPSSSYPTYSSTSIIESNPHVGLQSDSTAFSDSLYKMSANKNIQEFGPSMGPPPLSGFIRTNIKK